MTPTMPRRDDPRPPDRAAAPHSPEGTPIAGEGGAAFRGRLLRRLLVGVAVAAAVYGALALWTDVGALREALSPFPGDLLLVVCALSFGGYALRFVKWEIYRRSLGIELSRGNSFGVFLSGFALSVTPGKMGEVLKSVLLKHLTRTPIHRSAPIVVAERLTDLLAFLLLMAGAGMGTYPHARGLFAATFALLLLAAVLAASRNASAATVAIARRLPGLRRLAPKIEGAWVSAGTLLRPSRLPFPTALSVASWGLECIGFFLVARAFLATADLGRSIFAYAFGSVAGAVSMLPGGLGVTEASLGFLLQREVGLSPAAAAASTIVVRLGTLWFAVLVGLVSLAWFLRRHGTPPPTAADSTAPNERRDGRPAP